MAGVYIVQSLIRLSFHLSRSAMPRDDDGFVGMAEWFHSHSQIAKAYGYFQDLP